MVIVAELIDSFVKEFGNEPILFKSPGRVNIIGEHTDYNDGLVLPFPISQSIFFAISKRADNEVHVHALDLDEKIILPSKDKWVEDPWMRYFQGAFRVFKEDGYEFSGFNIMTKGDIPFGAGISSSSALTCGFIYAVSELFELGIPKREIVFMASRAENSTGLQGGKMDQFAICMGESGSAILLDCRDYSYELVPASLDHASWVLFNTNVKHNLVDTEYNDRRKDCEDSFEIIKNHHPDLTSIRELTSEILAETVHIISRTQFERLTHVVDENIRVEAMVEAMGGQDLKAMGTLLYESHHSLSELYEVSCEELDFIVSFLKDQHYCHGARMMGGGFGGSVIALINENDADYTKLKKEYQKAFNLELDVIPVESGDGVSRYIP